ncbi:hypothetical protein BD779DRAFT_1672253 [Infundibulicybe gibba]|nr:hypothetical protein BD779DRAFT_1672253 [Infundibulicybe gibba]
MQSSKNITRERRAMLDRLVEIPLKGFTELDETPTSGTASLPTPQTDHVSFDGLQPPPEPMIALWPYSSDRDDSLVVPPAPMMKDYDSFTDGTGRGSFDSIPAGSTDEFGDPIYPINLLSLELLPPVDTSSSIEQWRNHVSINTSTQSSSDLTSGNKHPRSPTSEDGRRTRARAYSLSSASSISNTFEWDATPFTQGRPPSRANSVPD